jgi:hypothetical protein
VLSIAGIFAIAPFDSLAVGEKWYDLRTRLFSSRLKGQLEIKLPDGKCICCLVKSPIRLGEMTK